LKRKPWARDAAGPPKWATIGVNFAHAARCSATRFPQLFPSDAQLFLSDAQLFLSDAQLFLSDARIIHRHPLATGLA